MTAGAYLVAFIDPNKAELADVEIFGEPSPTTMGMLAVCVARHRANTYSRAKLELVHEVYHGRLSQWRELYDRGPKAAEPEPSPWTCPVCGHHEWKYVELARPPHYLCGGCSVHFHAPHSFCRRSTRTVINQ